MASCFVSSQIVAASGDLRRSCAMGFTSRNCKGTSWRLERLLLRGIAGTLSCVLVVSSPSLAFPSIPPLSSPAADLCREDEALEGEAVPPEALTNVGLVEEAWDVVNESFLGSSSWSPEKWLKVKKEVLQSNIRTRSKAHEVIRKMLASLGDPYTRFLSPSEFAKMAKYDMTGIGVNLREVPDDNGSVKLKVLGVILDGPAHSAGVKQGDEILSVNGVSVKGKSAFDVSLMLQGPKDTFVTIEVKHRNCGPIQSIKLQRQLVARSPVFYHLEKGDDGSSSVGYIHIKEFNSLARKDLLIALKRLQASGASYFVLDLRDNLGGLVEAGIEVAKLFLNNGETIIYTAGRDTQIQKSIIAETEPTITAPLIVLVNSRTASTSEIVATALHDNCKAILVGEKTFGKGLIQSVFELHDGSGVVVTIGKYVTPNHMDINGNGIQPDFPRPPALRMVRDYLSQCQGRRMG